MLLSKQLKTEGDFCFGYRSYLPLFLLPALIFVSLCFGQNLVKFENLGDSSEHYAYSQWLIYASILIGFVGEGIRMFVAGFAARGTSGRNTRGQVADELNTTGAYSICRNPLYLGNFLMMLAPVILLGNALFVVIFVLAFWLYYERIIFAEESFLLPKFGSDYEKWADKTPCFLPRFSAFVKPKLPLSISTIIRKEYNSIYGLICSLFGVHYLIAILGYFKAVGVSGVLRGGGGAIILPDCTMSVLFVGFSVGYIVVRILVKKTNVFCNARV